MFPVSLLGRILLWATLTYTMHQVGPKHPSLFNRPFEYFNMGLREIFYEKCEKEGERVEDMT